MTGTAMTEGDPITGDADFGFGPKREKGKDGNELTEDKRRKLEAKRR